MESILRFGMPRFRPARTVSARDCLVKPMPSLSLLRSATTTVMCCKSASCWAFADFVVMKRHSIAQTGAGIFICLSPESYQHRQVKQMSRTQLGTSTEPLHFKDSNRESTFSDNQCGAVVAWQPKNPKRDSLQLTKSVRTCITAKLRSRRSRRDSAISNY